VGISRLDAEGVLGFDPDMTGAKPPPLRPCRRWKRPVVIVVLATFLVLLSFVLFGIWRVGISRDIRRLEAKARTAGEPITLQELAATRKPIPDEENAAVALMDIWQDDDPAFWKAFRAGAKKLPKRTKPRYNPNLPLGSENSWKLSHLLPWNDAQIEAARAFVATNQVRAERIQAALSLPKAQFPLNFADGYKMLVPHLSALRYESKRLQVANLLAITENHPDLALNELGEMMQLSDTIRDEPLLFSQLVRMGCIGIAFTGTEQFLQRSTLNESQLHEISSLLASIDVRMAFYQGLLGDRVNGLSMFNKPIDEPASESDGNSDDDKSAPVPPRGKNVSSWPVNVLGILSDERLILQTYDQLTDLSRRGNWNQILKALGVIHKAGIAAMTFPPKMISKLVLPSPKAAEKCVSVEARRRCALLAVEIVRFRQAHEGRLPETLDSIIAKNPSLLATDPFDGKSLRYRVLPDGFVVYSVGPDRIDQRGDTVRHRNNPTAYDVAFTVAGRASEETGLKTPRRKRVNPNQ